MQKPRNIGNKLPNSYFPIMQDLLRLDLQMKKCICQSLKSLNWWCQWHPSAFSTMHTYWHTCSQVNAHKCAVPKWDIHNGANLMLDLGLKPWYGWYQLYPSGFSTIKAHWLMWEPMHTTLLILRMNFHNAAKSEQRIGYWKLSFCQRL